MPSLFIIGATLSISDSHVSVLILVQTKEYYQQEYKLPNDSKVKNGSDLLQENLKSKSNDVSNESTTRNATTTYLSPFHIMVTTTTMKDEIYKLLPSCTLLVSLDKISNGTILSYILTTYGNYLRVVRHHSPKYYPLIN